MSYSLRSLLSQVTPSYLANIGVDLGFNNLAEWSHVYEHTYFLGPLNAHLTTPRNPRNGHPEARTVPLDPQAAISGRYLLLTWLHHDGYFWLQECNSREDIAAKICNGDVVWGGFVGFEAAWEDGTILPYRVHYTDWQGTRKVLDRSRPDPIPDEESDLESYLSQAIEIEWLDAQVGFRPPAP